MYMSIVIESGDTTTFCPSDSCETDLKSFGVVLLVESRISQSKHLRIKRKINTGLENIMENTGCHDILGQEIPTKG